MRPGLTLLSSLVAAVLATAATAQMADLSDPDALTARNVALSTAEHRGVSALRVVEAGERSEGEDKLAIVLPDGFRDGTIEVMLAGDRVEGAPEGARGFVGLAFRVQPDGSAFEAIYLRPYNGRSEDQLQRNHSIQYISYPAAGWRTLREETPGKYESYVDLEPGAWTRLRIEVAGTTARAYVGEASQPALIVRDLRMGTAEGGVALWIGPGTLAHFRDLSITRN
ncbi:MAG: hypothetical protein HXY25_00555 [Alphaproteobacteria bacterium]|nr:hypothetical protein [Alphaproteobacteria bacterium]